jgi:hypothetical protein
MPVHIFYSYAREDASFLADIRASIAPLQHQKRIIQWWDRRELAGVDWEEAIRREVDRARLIVLLVSKDFLNSEYCHKETTQALDRQRVGLATVVPVLIRQCNWKIGSFSRLNMIPADAKSISTWDDLDAAWAHVGEELTSVIESLESGSATATATTSSPAETWARRVLDAVVPSEVPFGQTHALRVMIRTPHSGGLREFVASEPGSAELTVRASSPFSIPVRAGGLELKIRVFSPTLEFTDNTKSVVLPPHDDSGVIALSFQALRIGQHEIVAELLTGDIAWVSHLLRTVTRSQGGGPGDIRLEAEEVVIASVTLYVQCISLTMRAGA